MQVAEATLAALWMVSDHMCGEWTDYMVKSNHVVKSIA